MQSRRAGLLILSPLLLFDSCSDNVKPDEFIRRTPLLNEVTNATIQFLTTRDDNSALPTLGRRVMVTGPPGVVEFMGTGDVRVLDELVELLRDPNRAWAAEVVLASLTHNEENIVNAFATNPAHWQDSVGKDAYARWKEWLETRRGKLQWNPQSKTFESN